MKKQNRILIIYAGGTIGMFREPIANKLVPMSLEKVKNDLPELLSLNAEISYIATSNPIDSANSQPQNWVELAEIIQKNYNDYEGFVILHGTDTLAYTASALSFILDNLSKAVVLTGSQLPVNEIRTDARENIITAIEIASAYENDKAVVPEVCIYFEYKLYRGNRTTKYSASSFKAYRSPNYPLLATAGIQIDYNYEAILPFNNKNELAVSSRFNSEIGVIRLFPGISFQYLEIILYSPLKSIILETYGSGNAPEDISLFKMLREASDSAKIIVNISQCPEGMVDMERYTTGKQLIDAGVVSGSDMTFEAALTKLMFLNGRYDDLNKIKSLIPLSLKGECN